MTPVGAKHPVQNMSHVLQHDKERDAADHSDQYSFRGDTGGPEADPFMFNRARKRKGNQEAGVSVSVIHHPLRIHQKLSVYICHGIWLECNINDRKPAENEHSDQKQLLLFRMVMQVIKNLCHKIQGQSGFQQCHQDILRGVDPQVVSGKSGECQCDQADHGKNRQFLPVSDRNPSVDRPRRGCMSAGKGISGGCFDRVSGRHDPRIPDPWPVDAGCQFDNCVESAAQIIGCQRIETLVLVHYPVDEYRDHNQKSNREKRNALSKGRKDVICSISKVL